MRKCWAAKPENRILFPEVIEELCSLDDHGERINVDETDGRHQLVENYQGKTFAIVLSIWKEEGGEGMAGDVRKREGREGKAREIKGSGVKQKGKKVSEKR